ncbi:MAG: tryptophan synthase subunit alpha [Pseudomonadota bacterium]
MSRIDHVFAELGGQTALVAFVTAGDPSPDHTVPALHALVEGGADVLELGIPFSDPEAEGPAIQAASERALANGIGMSHVLAMVEEFRQQDTRTPIVLMGYLNSVLAMPDFAERAHQAGVDGLIMVNLPPEEAEALRVQLAAKHINLVFLVAPTTTPERASMILSKASGFVYYVSTKGTTGSGTTLAADAIRDRVAQLKAGTSLPVCVGFGIKDATTAAQVGAHADGVVVGTALVATMADYPDDVSQCAAALLQQAAELKGAIR